MANFTLDVPLNASGVQDFKPDQSVTVAAIDGKGGAHEQTVNLDASGHGTATFTFDEHPGALHVSQGQSPRRRRNCNICRR